MAFVFGRVIVGAAVVLAMALPAFAGMPRGAIVSADEQDADAATGVTIAHGNAEISVEKSRILGRADSIEINPAKNEILFKGRAVVSVGAERFDGAAVTCSLDFNKCAAGVADTVAAAPLSVTPGQLISPPAGVGSAETNPR